MRIQRGADVNVHDLVGRTPLFSAQKIDTVQLLPDHGANVNARDYMGHTALHQFVEESKSTWSSTAAKAEYRGIIQLLRAHGAVD